MSSATSMRLATRGSPLALWQARRVADLLGSSGVATSLVVVDTEGDRRTDVSLAALGGKGVFVKEVQAAVLRGEADAAVHSAKDLPSDPALAAPGLTLAAFPERGDPRDLIVGGALEHLATGSMVATGSARRRAQLAGLRPDLTFADLRGNMATRLGAVGRGQVTAVVVALAAIHRLAWTPPPGVATAVLELSTMIPQVGQGALAVECRTDDEVARQVLATIDDPSVRCTVSAERAFLAELGGGCTQPVGAIAHIEGEAGSAMLALTGMMASDDGRVVLRHRATGTDAEALGGSVARHLLDAAGGRSLGTWQPAPKGAPVTVVDSSTARR